MLLTHLTLKEDDNIEEDGIFVTDVPASDSEQEEADSESSGSYDQESSGSSSEDDAPSKPVVAAQSDGVVKHSPSEDTIKVFCCIICSVFNIYQDFVVESSDPDTDEDDIHVASTIGRVPLHWYNDHDHIGYDLDGKKVKSQHFLSS